MAYGSILGQTTPGVGAAIISGVVNNGETINAGDVVNLVYRDTLLSAVAPGTLVKLNENGSPVEVYVAAQNYESGLNGAGRTLLVRKDVYNQSQWSTANVNNWGTSALRVWLDEYYLSILDSNIQELIGKTEYYCTPGDGNWNVTTRTDAVFLLSMTELGQSNVYANVEGSALPIRNTLKIAYQNGNSTTQWTRSPYLANQLTAWRLYSDGSSNNDFCSTTHGVRPCFTLPGTLYVWDDGTVSPIETQLSDIIFTKQNTPYQAIALSSGTSGQTIQVIYSGITNASWVTARQKITSTTTGVQGYGVKDGMLEVFPYYRPQ